MSGGTIVGVNFQLSGGTLSNASDVTTGVALTGTAAVIANGAIASGTVSGVMSGDGFTKAGAGTLTLTAANNYTGLTTVKGGTLELANAAARTNVLANPQGIDLQAGQVVFDYANPGDDPAATVLANLTASYGAGSGPWTSGPMFSTTAAATSKVGLGWVDSGVGAGGTGTVTVKPAVYGDADLNGTVGSSDLSIVLSDFGKPGVWATGDFDYNGTVGSSDLSIVLANFGQSLPSSFNVASYTNLDAAAINMLNAAGIETVPEPGTLALLAAGLLGLLAYAWRKRK